MTHSLHQIYLLKLLGVAALYALLANTVLTLFAANGVVSIVWPLGGLALAVLLIGGRRYFPGIFLGAFIANTMIGVAPGVAAAIAAGSTLEAFLGAWLLTRDDRFDPNIRTLGDYLRLIALGGFVACGAAALNGSTTLLVSGFIAPGAYFQNLLNWWMGDVLGIALITPLILSWRQMPDDWRTPGKKVEVILLLGLMFLANQIVFLEWFHDPDGMFEQVARGYWMFLLITWVAVRARTSGVVIALAMTAAQALWGAALGVGFFAHDIAKTGLFTFWFYMMTLSVVGMALATYFTERKRIEEALRRSEENLNRAQTISQIGSWSLDIPTNRLEWSAETYRMFGIPQQQDINLESFTQVTHPDDRDSVLRAWDEAKAGAPYDIEHRIVVGGQERWVRERALIDRDAEGHPLNGIGTVQDITERRQMEERLRILFTAIEQSPLSIVITDLEAAIQYANPCFLETTGYSLKEAIGQNPRLLQSGLTPKETYDTMWKTLASGQTWQGELVNKRKNGKLYWEEVHITPVMDSAGVPAHYVAVKLEITERKEYEEELKRSNTELEQFGYAVSHDMRQPLRMISSYLQLLEMSLTEQLDGEKRDYFNFAIEGAKRIDQMLVDLLEYSRTGRNGETPTWVESSALLDEALRFLQPAITEARARVDIAGEWPRIHVSRDEILRLLQNLIGNAAKYRIARRTPEIVVTSEVAGNEWRLCVADNGIGIIPGQIKRLFQIFQRLQSREAYEGTGIGLALCRKIVEHHKGRIWAESEGEDRGSRFHVVLPVVLW